ncbi:MarC family protein [Reinekea thalattae]|uniref:MarC family protein n=1 Tax=Reinekea thalattae TaxID=2593301 RepID=UPI001FE520A1|nr:MarC family protein [Reinekea thalattae]
MILDKALHDFLIIWATVDPIGTMALFAGLTAKHSAKERIKTAYKTILYAALILTGAIVIGQVLLGAMGISLFSFQIAGGLILFLFGLQMIFSHGTSEEGAQEPRHDIAIFPLAIPATASPGAILAVILITDNHTYSIHEQFITTGSMLAVLGFTLIMLLFSEKIIRVIGMGGASLLTRIMGMILAALSVEFIVEALGLTELISARL